MRFIIILTIFFSGYVQAETIKTDYGMANCTQGQFNFKIKRPPEDFDLYVTLFGSKRKLKRQRFLRLTSYSRPKNLAVKKVGFSPEQVLLEIVPHSSKFYPLQLLNCS